MSYSVKMSIMTFFIISVVFCLILFFAFRNKRHTPPKITEKQKQADELIAVILPTINNDK